MSYTVLLQLQADFAGENSIQHEQVENAAKKVLESENAPDGVMLTIVLCTDTYMREMNFKYRGINAPTDVLAFPAPPMPPEMAEEIGGYLGDIVISLEYVAQRANEEQRSVQDDVSLMVVHGTLHLLGYDHHTPDAQKTMWAAQRRVLESLGIHLEVPDYIHDDDEESR